MSSFSSALWLAVACAVTITGSSAAYNPASACYSSGLLIKCAHHVTCEGYTTHLQCDQGQVLRIHSAEYGRQDYSTCTKKRPLCQVQNVFCTTPGATSKVAKKCDGKNRCSIKATDAEFGDTCAGTYKYLQVAYFCQPQSTFCEGQSVHLGCGSGKVIRVHAADYGRWDRTTCAAGQTFKKIRNTNCASTSSTYKVAKMCNGKVNCTVAVTNKELGNPCRGTFKYMRLSAFCITPS